MLHILRLIIEIKGSHQYFKTCRVFIDKVICINMCKNEGFFYSLLVILGKIYYRPGFDFLYCYENVCYPAKSINTLNSIDLPITWHRCQSKCYKGWILTIIFINWWYKTIGMFFYNPVAALLFCKCLSWIL